MSRPSPAPAPAPPPARAPRRRAWLGALGLRLVISIAALPLTPVLLGDHLLTLVAMRPTREFLVLAGFRIRTGELDLLPLLLASAPMVFLGMWVFYAAGRAYRDRFDPDHLPAWLARSVDPEQVARLEVVLRDRGMLLVVLARLAIFPTTLLGAAAGASGMSPRRYLTADTIGAILAYGQYVGAGYVLGRAYESAGIWITAVGVALMAVILWVFGRALQGGEGADDGSEERGQHGPWRPAPDTPSA